MSARRASAVVVGADPAGVAAVGALVAKRLRVLWLDPQFTVGALQRYKSVPANTKVDILARGFSTQFLPQGLPTEDVRLALTRMAREAYTLSANPDPSEQGWTTLGACQELMQAMTHALMAEPTVSACHGRAVAIEQQIDGEWLVRVAATPDVGASAAELHAPCVILAPGGVPNAVPAALQPGAWARELSLGNRAQRPRVLDPEHALELHRLPELLCDARTVGVVGGGHSGGVLAQHLHETLELPLTKLFVRSPLRLAQWEAHEEGYGAWAFRGLKGVAADYAVRHGLVGMVPPNGPVAPGLELHDSQLLTECAAVSADLDAVVFCLGFQRAPLPPLTDVRGVALDASALQHQAPGGALTTAPATGASGEAGVTGASGTSLEGLFGIGLAFSDDEFSSGAAYGEVGFFPFAARAAEIADAIGRLTWLRHRRRLDRPANGAHVRRAALRGLSRR